MTSLDVFQPSSERVLDNTPISTFHGCSGPLSFALVSMDRVLSRDVWPLEDHTPVYIVHRHGGLEDPMTMFQALAGRCHVLRVPTGDYTQGVFDEPSDIATRPQPNASGPLDAWSAAQQVLGWIGITHADLARITGIGRSTFFYWKQSGASPRPKTLRPLWRLHALASGLVSALGEQEALHWFSAGSPTPRDLLLAGDIDDVENRAHRLLFRQPSLRNSTSHFGVGAEDVEPEPAPAAPTRSLRRATRRPTSGRLGPPG